jgi:hypothetical protein
VYARVHQCSARAPMNLRLYEDEHLLLEKFMAEPILVVRRTATAPSAQTIESFVPTIRKAFAGIDRTRCVMLVDLRAAPLRSSDDLDRSLLLFRAEVARDVRALARILATSVGALQIRRLGGDEERPTRSFSNEDEALAWLRTEAARPGSGARLA